MMDDDEYSSQFVGGTVYQAFLSAKSYHHWHSPIDGKIVKVKIVDGTYYSETLAEGFDSSGPNESQGNITEVATRAIVFIQADNPDIGLMCFLAVGMAEVSSCEVFPKEGSKIKKRSPSRNLSFRWFHPLFDFSAGGKADFRFTPAKSGT